MCGVGWTPKIPPRVLSGVTYAVVQQRKGNTPNRLKEIRVFYRRLLRSHSLSSAERRDARDNERTTGFEGGAGRPGMQDQSIPAVVTVIIISPSVSTFSVANVRCRRRFSFTRPERYYYYHHRYCYYYTIVIFAANRREKTANDRRVWRVGRTILG